MAQASRWSGLALVAFASGLLAACGSPQVESTPESADAPDQASSAAGADDPLAAFAWLSGHWVSPGAEDGGRSEEVWMLPRGGTMIGMNRTASPTETQAFEFLRILFEDGAALLLASPGGRTPPTAFRCVENENQRAVFENPEHDFPQRIIYRREGNALHGRIEGEGDDGPASAEWSWELASPLTR